MAAASSGTTPGADADPELRALIDARRALEDRIAALKASKERADPAQYASELEQLLIDLARTNRAIREKQKQ
jgi:hypothetical protein